MQTVDEIVMQPYLYFLQDVKLAAETTGIYVVVSGLKRNRMEAPIIEHDVIIFQSSCHGSFIWRLDLTLSGRSVIRHRHRLTLIDD